MVMTGKFMMVMVTMVMVTMVIVMMTMVMVMVMPLVMVTRGAVCNLRAGGEEVTRGNSLHRVQQLMEHLQRI